MNCSQTNKVLFLVVAFLTQTYLFAQTKPIVEYIGKKEIKVSTGKQEKINLVFSIMDDFYIQGHELENEYFIPTVLKITPSERIIVGNIQYPPAIKYAYTDNAVLDIYKKEIVITLPIEVVNSTTKPTDLNLTGSLYYQACSKVKCYYPRTLDFIVKIKTRSKQVASR